MEIKEAIQDWKYLSDIITYISRLEDIANKLPVKFYTGDADNVAIVIKEGENVTPVFTSNHTLGAEKFNKSFDINVMTNLEDGTYALDFVSNFIIARNKPPYYSPSLFSRLPPNILNPTLDSVNFFFINETNNWFRCYGRKSSLPHIMFILENINKINLDSGETLVDKFGVLMIIKSLVSQYNLIQPSAIEIEDLIKYIEFFNQIPNYKINNLLLTFYKTVEKINNPLDESNVIHLPNSTLLVPESSTNLLDDDEYDFPNTTDEWRDTLIKRGKIKGGKNRRNKHRKISLSKLITLPHIPYVEYSVYTDIDIKISGILEVVILPGKQIQVKYDSSYITEFEIRGIFEAFEQESILYYDFKGSV